MLSRRVFLSGLAVSILALSPAGPVRADQPAVYAVDGAAIGGHDPVAYFTEGRAVRGDPAHAVVWRGAEWRFASARNREAFEANPRAYAPQYGGYCVYAMSKGQAAPTDPEAWKIVQGKLYLNYNRSVQQIWSQDIPGHVAQADTNWPGVIGQ